MDSDPDESKNGARPRWTVGTFLLPILIAFFGVAITTISWMRVEQDRELQAIDGISRLAEESRTAIQRRVENHVGALKNLARFWQLHGLLSEEAWSYDTGMVLDHFPGIYSISWINSQGIAVRHVAADTSSSPTEDVLAQAVDRLENPGREYFYPEARELAMEVYLPVRTPEDSVGVLAAAVRSDSLFGGASFETAQGLAFVVHTEDGREIYRRGEPDTAAPSFLRASAVFPLSTGGVWSIQFLPESDYVGQMESPWSNYFLLVGILLSIALGAIVFQVSRLRAVSNALESTNRQLDARVRELSERDANLQHLNQELEARVEARTAELREVLHELETFSHSVSHDLRSPIGAVTNFASILEEDFGDRLDDEGRRLLERIQRSSKSAIELLNELVLFAGIGREEMQRSKVDMNEVARRAARHAADGEEKADEETIRIEPLPPAAADSVLVERIFTNLLSNALKYSRARETRNVTVRAEKGDGMNTYIVEDNGIGFDPERSEALFAPFERLHSARDYEGTGLGLAMVKKIVNRQGGRIWADSDGSNGARFSFTLPSPEDGT